MHPTRSQGCSPRCAGTAPPQGHSQDLADDPAPYRGLAPFEVDDAVFFTGRSVELDQMLERLLHCPFLAVLGASGSGKTSLIQAGLLAPLPDPVRNLSPHSETGREPALTGPRCGMSLYDLRRP